MQGYSCLNDFGTGWLDGVAVTFPIIPNTDYGSFSRLREVADAQAQELACYYDLRPGEPGRRVSAWISCYIRFAYCLGGLS